MLMNKQIWDHRRLHGQLKIAFIAESMDEQSHFALILFRFN